MPLHIGIDFHMPHLFLSLWDQHLLQQGTLAKESFRCSNNAWNLLHLKVRIHQNFPVCQDTCREGEWRICPWYQRTPDLVWVDPIQGCGSSPGTKNTNIKKQKKTTHKKTEMRNQNKLNMTKLNYWTTTWKKDHFVSPGNYSHILCIISMSSLRGRWPSRHAKNSSRLSFRAPSTSFSTSCQLEEQNILMYG